MSQEEIHQIKQNVKERMLAKIRLQWFKEFKTIGNVSAVCRQFGISRSQLAPTRLQNKTG